MFAMSGRPSRLFEPGACLSLVPALTSYNIRKWTPPPVSGLGLRVPTPSLHWGSLGIIGRYLVTYSLEFRVFANLLPPCEARREV